MNKRLLMILIAMTFASFIGLSGARALGVGDAAPTPNATDQNGSPLSFAEMYKKGVTLVYFYPKADTPGCTAEACSLRDDYANLRAKGVSVIGVSEDKAAAQKRFEEKYKLPFPLVADASGEVAKAFGVPALLGFAKRQSFLIKDGKVAWRDLNASTKNQAVDVMKAFDGLK